MGVLRRGAHDDEGALERAKDFLRGCAVVGITEALPDFLDDVARILNSPFGRDLERARGYSPDNKNIDPALAQRIRRKNEADDELYALACELSAKRRRERLYHRLTRPLRLRRLRPPLDLTQASEVQWAVDQPFFGSSWSDLQSWGDANCPPHRWTLGARSSLWMRVRRGRRYHLRVGVLRFVSRQQAFQLRIRRRPVKLRCISQDRQHGPGGGVYEGEFTARNDGNVRMEFCVNDALPFAEIDRSSRDRTRRGVAIQWVHLVEKRASRAPVRQMQRADFVEPRG
jgi:hypothetical protein